MSKSSDTIEDIAVNTVKVAFENIDEISAKFINSGDKFPVWDGNLVVYKNKSHKKSDGVRTIPIQMKGKLSSKLDKKTIKYPVSVADLNNFKSGKGVIYFVVLISDKLKQVYYSKLLPFDLVAILNGKSNNTTINIDFDKLPDDDFEKLDICLEFLSDQEKQQVSDIISKQLTLEQLQKDSNFKNFSFGFTTSNPKQKPFGSLFDRESYIYANMLLCGSDVTIPFSKAVVASMAQNKNIKFHAMV
jgi:hypothetical protein